MVVVEHRVRECLCHVSDLFSLSHEVQRAVLDELQDIGSAVRTVQINVTLLLTDEGLVAHRLEELPGTDEVLYHTDIRTRLDVEVTSIEETAYIQSWDEFIGFIFRICSRPLTMQVEVVALWCLQITLLEGLTMPGTIALGDVHVIHVDGHPYVGGGIGDLVIHVFIDQEVVGLRVAILDVIHTRLTDTGEVELHIVIFEIGPPWLDLTREDFLFRTVVLDAVEGSIRLRGVLLVEFDHGHLWLFGGIAHLTETDIRFTDPSWDGMRLNGPGQHLTRLTLRQYTAQHEPAILSQHTSIEELQLRVTADAHHTLRVIGSHDDLMTCLQRQGIDEAVCTTIIVCLETLELTGLLTVRTGNGLTRGITRETVQTTIHREGLQPVT